MKKNYFRVVMLLLVTLTAVNAQNNLGIESFATNSQVYSQGFSFESASCDISEQDEVCFLTVNSSNQTVAYVNGTPYFDILELPFDESGTISPATGVRLTGDNKEFIVFTGFANLSSSTPIQTRAVIRNVSNPGENLLAISFNDLVLGTDIFIKDSYILANYCYILVEGLRGQTTVTITDSNNTNFDAGALTGTGNALLMIDLNSKLLVGNQIFFTYDTRFGRNSLVKTSDNNFLFSTISFQDDSDLKVWNFDENLILEQNGVANINAQDVNYLGFNKMAWGQLDTGESVVGLIAGRLPVLVNTETMDVTYINTLDDALPSINESIDVRSADFRNNTFYFSKRSFGDPNKGGWFSAVNAKTKIRTYDVRFWLTNSANFNGMQSSQDHIDARLERHQILGAGIRNGMLRYITATRLDGPIYSGAYMVSDGTHGANEVIIFESEFDLDLTNLSPEYGIVEFKAEGGTGAVEDGNIVRYTGLGSALSNAQVLRTPGTEVESVFPGLIQNNVDFSEGQMTHVLSADVDFNDTSENTNVNLVMRWGEVGEAALSTSEVEEVSLGIYPNPASHTINFPQEFINNDYLVEIFDISGRKIMSIQNLTTRSLDISGFASGTYVVRLGGNQKQGVAKIVKN